MSENKKNIADLQAMQAWPLSRKIQVTQTRIIEWYIKNKGQVYVSFSGGKDSTVLLDLARRIYPDMSAVFVDTGLEYPEIREFVKGVDGVTWLRPKMNFRNAIETYGYPLVSKEVAKRVYEFRNAETKNNVENCLAYKEFMGLRKSPKGISAYNKTKWRFLLNAPFKISHKCCDVMKKAPAKKYEKETQRKPFIATMACESEARRRSWLLNGCNAFTAKRPSSQPMSFWTEQDVLEYISTYNLPYAKVYGEIKRNADDKWCTTGVARTGCMFCTFGVQCEKTPNRFQRMKVTHPKQYTYCMKPTADGGLGIAEVLDYIGVEH